MPDNATTQAEQRRYLESYLLFTGESNVAAQRSYLAIGFRPIGDFGVVLFATA